MVVYGTSMPLPPEYEQFCKEFQNCGAGDFLMSLFFLRIREKKISLFHTNVVSVSLQVVCPCFRGFFCTWFYYVSTVEHYSLSVCSFCRTTCQQKCYLSICHHTCVRSNHQDEIMLLYLNSLCTEHLIYVLLCTLIEFCRQRLHINDFCMYIF